MPKHRKRTVRRLRRKGGSRSRHVLARQRERQRMSCDDLRRQLMAIQKAIIDFRENLENAEALKEEIIEEIQSECGDN